MKGQKEKTWERGCHLCCSLLGRNKCMKFTLDISIYKFFYIVMLLVSVCCESRFMLVFSQSLEICFTKI
jgi:hypothetical protein